MFFNLINIFNLLTTDYFVAGLAITLTTRYTLKSVL